MATVKRKGSKQKSISGSVSMTGFGKAIRSTAEIELTVEVKSVNHKFLDINFRMPRSYNELESEIRSEIAKVFQRGRVEIFVNRKVLTDDAVNINFNQPLFETYYAACSNVLEHYQALSEETRNALVFELATNREFLSADEDIAKIKIERKLLLAVLNEALSAVMSMRLKEGASLRKDILSRAATILKISQQVKKIAKSASSEKVKKLNKRIQTLFSGGEVDPIRLAQEAAILADRVDVTEELVRIESHFDQLGQALKSSPQGRKLDFIIQELFREWNTIGSKIQDGGIQSLVVEAKVELERLREQVQNLE